MADLNHAEAQHAWQRLDGHQLLIRGEQMTLELGAYDNGRSAVLVRDAGGIPYCKLTVNLPDNEIGADEFYVKENAPGAAIVAAVMKSEGLIERTLYGASASFCDHFAQLWRLCHHQNKFRPSASPPG